MTDPLETSELQAFARTVSARSLSQAARELGIPRATLSRRLARLEERLSVRLLSRSTRSLALTDAGEAFHRQAVLALEAVARAEASVHHSQDAVRGDLRVSTPPFTDNSFRNLVCEFCARYPDVRLHLDMSTRHIDLRKEGYDVALRASMDFEPGLIARVLSRAPTSALASPAYLKAQGVPQKLRDLRMHRCLMGFLRGELPQTHWPLLAGGKVQVEGAMFCNDISLVRDMVLRGLGIAVLPEFLVTDHLASGELVRVLPELIGAETRVAVVHLEREFVPPQVRAFVDAVIAWAQSGLPAPSPARRTRPASAPSRRKR
jgi:DNA-binding transcriptional LysR family regulator